MITRFQPPNQTGLDHISFGVAERTDLDAWTAWLDELGIEHSDGRRCLTTTM